MDEFIAMIKIFAGSFAPRGWAFCHGQLLPISQNTALFSLIGTTYGGDGKTTFALPDLRGRSPIGFGQGGGLSNYRLGEARGEEATTLNANNLPSHNHQLKVSTEEGSTSNPGNNYMAVSKFQAQRGAEKVDIPIYKDSANTAMGPDAISRTGNSQPFDNRSPYLGVNYIICLEGVYPSRN